MWPFKKQEINSATLTKPVVMEYTKEMQKGDGYLNAIANTISTMRRAAGGLFGVSHGGRRDANSLYGYIVNPEYSDYYQMYLNGDMAKAIIDKLPKSCWRDLPILKVNDERVLEAELEALKNFGFFKSMERADRLGRIGSFSVLVVGIPDGEDLTQPLGTAKLGDFESMYFNPYSEPGVTISKWDDDPASPRFDQPVMYSVQTTRTNTDQKIDVKVRSYQVHWSRIIHLAEGALESSIEGIPALQAAMNALTDKQKVRGASSEAFRGNVRQKIALEADNEAQFGPDEIKTLKANAEQWEDDLDSFLRLKNMKANVIQPGLFSPRDHYDICLDDIVGATGHPARVLGVKTGGNTTGKEDKASWNSLVIDRQESDCTIWLMVGLRMMEQAGMLELADNVTVEWQPVAALDELEASEVTANKAKALKDVLDALSTLGASDVDPKSVFREIGLDNIEIDNDDLSDTNLGGQNDS